MRSIGGKPLLQRAVEAAVRSKRIDKVFVSSDSQQYLTNAAYWASFVEKGKFSGIIRPPALAEDVPSEDVILHAVHYIENQLGIKVDDQLVTIQCTTPLLSSADIDGALAVYDNGGCKSVISVTRVREHPDWMFKIKDGRLRTYTKMDVPGPFDPVDRPLKGDWGVRQTREELYRPNGAIYVVSKKALIEEKTLFAPPIGAYIMPFERSWDIDEEIDLKILESLV